MDTKSKNISYSKSIKLIVFILALVASLSAMGCMFYLISNQEYVTNESFEETYQFRNKYKELIDDVVTLELELISEEHIKETHTNKTVLTSKLHELDKIKSRISQSTNFLYYIKNLESDLVKTNLSKSFDYLEDQYTSVYYLDSDFNSIDKRYSTYMFNSLKKFDEYSYEFRSAVKKDMTKGDTFYNEYQIYSKVRKNSPIAIYGAIISAIVLFASIIYLMVTTGRLYKGSPLYLSIIDHIPFEFQVLLFSVVASLGGIFISSIQLVNMYSFVATVLPVLGFIILAGLMFLLSITRRIKDHTFFKNFLIYKVCNRCITTVTRPIKKAFKMLFDLRHKTIFKSWILAFMLIYLIVNSILITIITNSWGLIVFLSVIIFIALNAKVFYEVYKFLNSLQQIILASDSVSYANDVKTLELDELSSSLHDLASNIINIQSGIRKAVDKALKGEQMKTALITNVSHDLKTPLTSIITYVDLLKKEKFTSDNASNYLQVLEEKSYRLKNLIEDIIEVNKASTGNMVVNREKVNLNELINQSMGEYEYKISDSDLEFKLNLPTEATFIEADSKSMWRILENLMENALKYSADNSRIYIDIEKSNNNGVFTIKNMSKLPLDISPEQLTERFVRGDSARSSAGSGLGLSIAQSLADIQGGDFELVIDGDLFKVVVTMPLWNDESN